MGQRGSPDPSPHAPPASQSSPASNRQPLGLPSVFSCTTLPMGSVAQVQPRLHFCALLWASSTSPGGSGSLPQAPCAPAISLHSSSASQSAYCSLSPEAALVSAGSVAPRHVQGGAPTIPGSTSCPSRTGLSKGKNLPMGFVSVLYVSSWYAAPPDRVCSSASWPAPLPQPQIGM